VITLTRNIAKNYQKIILVGLPISRISGVYNLNLVSKMQKVN